MKLKKADNEFVIYKWKRKLEVDSETDGVEVYRNDRMIKSRAKAREVSTDEYMRGNLLLNEVKAEDVAKAFFHLAISKKTTGAVLTVDGGNIAASLR